MNYRQISNTHNLNKLLLIFCLFIYGNSFAQEKFSKVLNFEVDNKIVNQDGDTISIKNRYHFLMLRPHKAIDLDTYGNILSEFKIVGSNSNRILLEFQQPTKLDSVGRCAAGLEKGFLYLELNDNELVKKSVYYFTESCLWSIETIRFLKEGSNIIKYDCENLNTSEYFVITIDTINATITQE